MKKLLKVIGTMSANGVLAVCVLMAGCVLVLDLITGEKIRFPILFVMPVALAALRNQRTVAYALVIGLSLARMALHFHWHGTMELVVGGVNALIYMLTLLFCAYLLDKTALQNKALEERVNILEGILPICAACKQIKNENGQYEQLEKYFHEHFQATFSHGLCPDCLKKLYPWFDNKEQ